MLIIVKPHAQARIVECGLYFVNTDTFQLFHINLSSFEVLPNVIHRTIADVEVTQSYDSSSGVKAACKLDSHFSQT